MAGDESVDTRERVGLRAVEAIDTDRTDEDDDCRAFPTIGRIPPTEDGERSNAVEFGRARGWPPEMERDCWTGRASADCADGGGELAEKVEFPGARTSSRFGLRCSLTYGQRARWPSDVGLSTSSSALSTDLLLIAASPSERLTSLTRRDRSTDRSEPFVAD